MSQQCNSFVHRESGCSYHVRVILKAALIALSLIVPLSARGQVSFEWGTIRRDTLYPTVEHCLAMVERASGSKIPIDTIFRDTMPPELRGAPNSQRPEGVTAAQQCSKKFTVHELLAPDSVDVNRGFNAFRLLYAAERMDEAITFAEGMIAKIPATKDTMRQVQRLTMVKFAFYERPTRFETIRRIVDSMDLQKFWADRVRFYGELMERAIALRDTNALAPLVAWLVQTPELLGDSILKTPQWNDPDVGGVGRYVVNAKQYLHRKTLLAKLEESTLSYHEALETLRKESGWGLTTERDSLAKPIIADYWFPNNPAGPRPTSGKIALVVSLRNRNECNPCTMHPELRRLAARFQEVEFTLLAQTFGQYGEQFETLSIADEAKLIDSMHRTVYGFPGIVAVIEGKSWKLPDPDGRVIDEAGPNQQQYPTIFPMNRKAGGPSYRLIDRNGRFVKPGLLGLSWEESLTLLIQALLRQPIP